MKTLSSILSAAVAAAWLSAAAPAAAITSAPEVGERHAHAGGRCLLQPGTAQPLTAAARAGFGGGSFVTGAAAQVCSRDVPSSMLTPDVQRRQYDFRLDLTT